MFWPIKSQLLRISLMLALCIFLTTILPAEGDTAKPKTFEVPYRVPATQHVMVRAKINGEGPFNLILDTGAPLVILAKKVAAQAKIDATDASATLDSLEIE